MYICIYKVTAALIRMLNAICDYPSCGSKFLANDADTYLQTKRKQLPTLARKALTSPDEWHVDRTATSKLTVSHFLNVAALKDRQQPAPSRDVDKSSLRSHHHTGPEISWDF
jgi:hypothetical protein